MHSPQPKTIIVSAVTILLVTVATVLWHRPDYTARLSSLHLSSMRTHSVTFTQRPEYLDLSEAGDANWTSLLPPNGGFVSQPSQRGPGREVVGITMFHQLHCLQMIRSTIQELQSARSGDRETDEVELEERSAKLDYPADGFGVRKRSVNTDSPEDTFGVRKRHEAQPQLGQAHHWVHCLDYLMQGILCAADDTIEHAHEDDDGRMAVDGYQVTHECRSADRIWETVMGSEREPGWRPASADLKQ